MKKSIRNYYVLTGGPGTGKTSLLTLLAEKGFPCIPEVAREIIKEQVLNRGSALPWADKEAYANRMWSESLCSYKLTLQRFENEVVFFDRGLLDRICYMEMEDIKISQEIQDDLSSALYKKVFILPPWEEIYVTDSERKQSWAEALETFESMKKVYEKYGYETIEVPKLSIAERVQFIERNL